MLKCNICGNQYEPKDNDCQNIDCSQGITVVKSKVSGMICCGEWMENV